MSQSLQWSEATCIHETHQYIENSPTPAAHTLETWTPPSEQSGKYWIIYIHGGAWWRPMITSSAFSLTVENLLSSSTLPSIAGFASLNYRLSAPPQLPQFKNFAEVDNPARNVKHPAHLNDIIAGLTFLQKNYDFAENYILVGHSCGATLTFQIPGTIDLLPPVAILGVEGIYDLAKLRDDYSAVPVYRQFIESAFGRDAKAWKLASPTTQPGERLWQSAKVVALVHSDEDELVDAGQRDVMWDVMMKSARRGRKYERIKVVGKHDEIWREEGADGTQLGVAIETVMRWLNDA